MIIKQMSDGRWYLCRRSTKGKKNVNQYREWFFVKDQKGLGRITLGAVLLPKEFIGKKIRFVVEVIKHEKKRPNRF